MERFTIILSNSLPDEMDRESFLIEDIHGVATQARIRQAFADILARNIIYPTDIVTFSTCDIPEEWQGVEADIYGDNALETEF